MDSIQMSDIGVKIAEGSVVPVLNIEEKEKGQEVFTTIADRQTKAVFEVFCREKSVSNWVFIGSMLIKGILPIKAGAPELELNVNVNEESDGSLLLSVLDHTSSKCTELQIDRDELAERYRQKGTVDSSDIGTMRVVESQKEHHEIERGRPSRKKRFYLFLLFVICAFSIFLFTVSKFQFTVLPFFKKWPRIEHRIENIFEKWNIAENQLKNISEKGFDVKHRFETIIGEKKLLLEAVKEKLKERIQVILPEDKSEKKQSGPSDVDQSEESREE